ncbi:uncharacterized protein LOC121738741 [Aricia agestis]|uniref:uncharacterized protein LOC121738741 n=1 Tax=Aricia agestis TaxID=91739 RepID=UPI001C20923E|nr:uncharacterized protein LOC121738741 [Aricia agestis]
MITMMCLERMMFLCFICLVNGESSKETKVNISNSTPRVGNNLSTLPAYPLEVFSTKRTLWLHRPEALQPYQSSLVLQAPRVVIQRQPFSVIQLKRLLGLGVAPYFHKFNFEPFDRRRMKPVLILALKKQGISPIQVTWPNKPPEVAELQSPYNQIEDHGTDEANFNAEVEKIFEE